MNISSTDRLTWARFALFSTRKTKRFSASRTLDAMRLGKRLYSLLIFLGVSVLGGGLVAGLVIPAVSMTTTTGRDAAQSLDAQPAEFPDLLHPNAKGYERWAAAMEPTLARLLGEKP